VRATSKSTAPRFARKLPHESTSKIDAKKKSKIQSVFLAEKHVKNVPYIYDENDP